MTIKKSRLVYQRGDTLVEMLIYMGLFAGFLALLSGLFVSTLDIQQQSLDSAEIEQDSQYLFSRIQYDVSRANAITTPASEGATSSALVLTTPSGKITYAKVNNQLQITDPSGSSILTSPDIALTTVSFQRLGSSAQSDSLKIQFHLQSINLQNSVPENRDINMTLGIR